jgi:hypothetical protein
MSCLLVVVAEGAIVYVFGAQTLKIIPNGGVPKIDAPLSINVEQLAAIDFKEVFKIFFVIILEYNRQRLIGDNC